MLSSGVSWDFGFGFLFEDNIEFAFGLVRRCRWSKISQLLLILEGIVIILELPSHCCTPWYPSWTDEDNFAQIPLPLSVFKSSFSSLPLCTMVSVTFVGSCCQFEREFNGYSHKILKSKPEFDDKQILSWKTWSWALVDWEGKQFRSSSKFTSNESTTN